MSCGFTFKASELKKDWRGLFLCKDDFEQRHPLDFVRTRSEDTSVSVNSPTDSEDDITITNVPDLVIRNPAASLSVVMFYYTTTGSGENREVNLPSAEDSTFKGNSVVYTLNLLAESLAGAASNYSITVTTSTGAIQGNTTIAIGTAGKFRNVPSQNVWIRES